MGRVKRYVFGGVAFLSLVLCMAATSLWVASYQCRPSVHRMTYLAWPWGAGSTLTHDAMLIAYDGNVAFVNEWFPSQPYGTVNNGILPLPSRGCRIMAFKVYLAAPPQRGGPLFDFRVPGLRIREDDPGWWYTIGCPLWMIVCVTGFVPAMWGYRAVRGGGKRRAAKRRAAGLCVRCAYDLRGNLSGVCPECGAPVSGNASGLE